MPKQFELLEEHDDMPIEELPSDSEIEMIMDGA